MKNNKGFAISSIIYSMLILFLGLILLILGNLANRKAIFDKEKNDILSKFNQDEILCTAKSSVTNGNLAYGQYNYGDEYTCNLGDGESKTFYVLETSGNSVSLIMNMNVGEDGKGTTSGNTVAWSSDGDNSNGPVTALSYLKSSTKNWTKVDSSQISLPSGQQIAIAGGDTAWTDSNYTGNTLSSWIYENLKVNSSAPYAYWTSIPYASDSSSAWYVYSGGILNLDYVDNGSYSGVRPVITISKDQIKNLTINKICKASPTVTKGNKATGNYNYGDEYICELGDGDLKTFFVLENNSDTVSLIMNMNVGSDGKGTTKIESIYYTTLGDYIEAGGTESGYSGDGYWANNNRGPLHANKVLHSRTSSWTKVDSSQISLPSANQIAVASGKSFINGSSNITELSSWLVDNTSTELDPCRYWTSTGHQSLLQYAWFVGDNYLGYTTIDDSSMVSLRPVITISKSDIEN